MKNLASYGILLCNIILLVSGQTLFKLGIQQAGGLVWARIVTSYYILGGLALYGMATALWFVVLSRLPLSVAYPLQSIAYVLALLVAGFLFGETVTLTRWVGIAIILIGVYVVSR
ncbi:EamA family transporter [Paenibacillus sp. J2TS4]|uniref:EamA family transporter n=1 Tax=Paenibacillus sp. J2TS4 TaxID=2807194 RepID=UPI001B1BA039|nr:EamA family transporter [Paenibacillus sp. J2TS4]GIP35756.1 membrane protein [Paenibacillus sp. J2TS4]